jgi:hypothetical protein
MLLFYLAFTTAFPQGNRRLYMLLIFLYPSLLLWTSSLGKDALVIMLLGMAAYGLARLQQRLSLGGLWLAVGIIGVFWVRPHMAAIFLTALAASMIVFPVRLGYTGPIVRIVGVVVVALSVQYVLTSSGYGGFLEEPEAVFESISRRQWLSTRGGSAFEQVDVRSAAGLVMAVPTILFRPFPWEAHRLTALIASLEGLGLLALLIYRRRSVSAALAATTRSSYLLFIAVYAVLFILIFTALANFGIIARQRASMLFPFLFMWVAYLPSVPHGKADTGGDRHR